MVRNTVFALAGAVSAFLLSEAGVAADKSDFIAAYNKNKEAALTGIRPETRTEFVKCMMVWGYEAMAIDDNADYEVSVDADFTMATADEIYRHWWGVAEQAYGASRFPQMAADMTRITQAYYDEPSYLPIYADLGTCFVPAAQRKPAKRATPMEIMPSNGTAAVPLGLLQRYAGVPETGLPFRINQIDWLDKIVDGTIKANKKKKFRGLRQVAIPHFAVSFGLADSAQTRARSSNIYAAGTRISAAAEIEGLTTQVLQDLTNFAYQDFILKLKEAGYQVVDGQQSQRMLFQNKLNRTKVYNEPVRNMSVYHNAFNPNFKDITFAPKGMSLITPMWEASMATKKMGVPALNVQYSVHFA